MKKKLLLLIPLLVIATSCSLFVTEVTEYGEFMEDEQIIEYLQANIDDIEALIETKEMCDEVYREDNSVEIPVYCDEIKQKLGVVEIDYSESFETKESGDRVVHPNMMLVTYKIVWHEFMGWNVYEKGIYFSTKEQVAFVVEGDLNTRPKEEDCRMELNFVEIDEELPTGYWYLYTDYFCD